LKGEDSEKIPELKDFRSYVNGLKCSFKEQVFIKTLYLTAAKPSELLTKTTPYQLKHNKSYSYGSLLEGGFTEVKMVSGDVRKILLLKLAVAKQTRKKIMVPRFFQNGYGPHQEGYQSQADPSELVEAFSGQPEKVRMRVVPIPVSIEYEPWIYDVLKWYKDQKTHSFRFTEMTAQNIVRRNFRKLNPAINPRLIRKFRIAHLMKNYDFNPYQIAIFTGSSLSPVFKSIGMEAPSSKDSYYKKQLVDLIEKLLVPLDQAIENTLPKQPIEQSPT